MKKTYLIIIGITAVLVLLAIWVYLLIYGTPKPVENFFTDFSFTGDTSIDNIIPTSEVTPDTEIALEDTPLRQLTTRPVVGMGVHTENNGTFMRYVEAGTGHVFSINLETGAEIRLSNITIQNVEAATFDENSANVILQTGSGVDLLTLGGENTAVRETLTQKMADVTFTTSGQILYTTITSDGVLGLSLEPGTKTTRTIFTVPFQSATVLFSKDNSGPHYVYPKVSSVLPGYLYTLASEQIKSLGISGTGLSALAQGDRIVFTRVVGGEPLSRSFNPKTNTSIAIPVVAEPKKCVIAPLATSIMYCGNERVSYGNNFPDDWYKGTRSFSDQLLKIDLDKGSASTLINPKEILGRDIDVTELDISTDGEVLYFINKNDNTLWMYEI
jgi:hypothetical protein